MKLKGVIIAITVVAVSLLSSCHYSEEHKVIDAQGKFTIEVPSWTKEDLKLKPGAQFQYANRFRNFYAIGEVIAKDTTPAGIDSLMRFNLNVLRKSLNKPIVSDSNAVIINGLNGARVEIFGKMTSETIYFSEVLLEGKSNFYHLSVWTRGEDRKLKFKAEIERILNSFKEK
jgi:hypothetical protein